MPLYAYDCNSCGREFETLVRSGEAPECPSCGAVELTRRLSLIAKPAAGGEAAEAPCAATGASGGCGAGCPAFSECA
jgi:putative FmdB family regulatory protein